MVSILSAVNPTSRNQRYSDSVDPSLRELAFRKDNYVDLFLAKKIISAIHRYFGSLSYNVQIQWRQV